MMEDGIKNLEDCYVFRNIGHGHHPIVHLNSNRICCAPVPGPQSLGYGAEIGALHEAVGNRFPGHVRVVGDRGNVIVVNVTAE